MIALADFVKQKRKEVNLTQEAFAERAGVALTVVRKNRTRQRKSRRRSTKCSKCLVTS
ncbi:helix-turn-helix domain-containing protein [Albibacterium sp.]|uniref:helix-turn-helix domain-containing protein n=1 Tax=Albibacterium sp. TaxID=2952885 RepID=UPI0039C856E0